MTTYKDFEKLERSIIISVANKISSTDYEIEQFLGLPNMFLDY